jgi:D-3-phosphoglycerate dehydrogenase
MPPKKLLIADPLHPIFKEEAEQLGYEVDDRPELTKAETVAILGAYSAIAVRTKFQVDKEVIDAGTNLEVILRAGAGTDNIDVGYAESKGITCLHAAEGNCDAVGEHAIGMLLSLMNNLSKADREVRGGIWDREGNRGHELGGKTVAIIGYGYMGRSFAEKLKGFDVTVIAYDKYKTGFGDTFVREVDMEEVTERADVLSIHLPLTAETRRLINHEFFLRFRKPVWFINTSRGGIADTPAVLEAIREKRLFGAALDVLETERFPGLAKEPWFNELIQNGRVILSPHVAGWTFESYRRISEILARKLCKLAVSRP